MLVFTVIQPSTCLKRNKTMSTWFSLKSHSEQKELLMKAAKKCKNAEKEVEKRKGSEKIRKRRKNREINRKKQDILK